MSSQNDSTETNQESSLGASEQSLIAARRAKAVRMRSRGEDPFTNDIDPASIVDLGRVRAQYANAHAGDGKYDAGAVDDLKATSPWGDKLVVAGRVTAARSFGKATFVRIRDAFGTIQLFCRKNVLGDGYARLDDIDVADHVLASGVVMVTKTGELSIEATDLRLLTKAYRPLPDKWHGLSDVEVRYRRRYVDLIANEAARDVFRARAQIVRAVRSYLDARGFLEVETPTMNSLVGGAAARPFTTHHNALGMPLFMRIAPELYLKRLVVGGFERVYEVARCYRNEGLSTRHNPEFTMLEFYMAYATYETLMHMTEELFRHVDARLAEVMPAQHAVWMQQRPFRLDVPFERRKMRDLLRHRFCAEVRLRLGGEAERELCEFEKAGVNADVIGDAARLESAFEAATHELVKLSLATKKQLSVCENHGERIFLLYELLVEPHLAVLFRQGDKSVPVFVTDYPVETSPLARRQTRAGGDPNLVDRFELFVDGREVCNAFSELNDPDDQAARFREQAQKKARGVEETMDYDDDYIRALEHGLPPTAGFGMGIDRLTMALTAQDSIREVILFPLLRPER
jgi:lysyl-tRNA synthetase class 2